MRSGKPCCFCGRLVIVCFSTAPSIVMDPDKCIARTLPTVLLPRPPTPTSARCQTHSTNQSTRYINTAIVALYGVVPLPPSSNTKPKSRTAPTLLGHRQQHRGHGQRSRPTMRCVSTMTSTGHRLRSSMHCLDAIVDDVSPSSASSNERKITGQPVRELPQGHCHKP